MKFDIYKDALVSLLNLSPSLANPVTKVLFNKLRLKSNNFAHFNALRYKPNILNTILKTVLMDLTIENGEIKILRAYQSHTSFIPANSSSLS